MISTILIVLILLVLLVVGASLLLGRSSYEVDSARDTEFLELDGSWVRYDVIGGGPPVVLVHGWLSSSRVWEPLARRLAQRFTVYRLDLVGFGESDKPGSGYGVRNGSRLLYAFCAHFGLTRAGVIGHDIGGNMVVKLAADHPDVVGRIVLVSVPAEEDQIDLPTALWLATVPVVGPLFYALGRAASPVRRMWMRPFVADPEDLDEQVVEDAASSTPAAMSKTLSISRREISRGRLVRQARVIKMPMLVVSGEEDQIVDPHAVSAWAGSVERSEVCLLDACGHLPMIERTAEFNAQILAFLTGDARYLDHVEPGPAETAEEPDEEPDQEPGEGNATRETEVQAFPGDEETGESTEPAQTPPARDEDDTADITLEDPEPEPEVHEPPNIVRKRGGRYSARTEDASPSQDGAEDHRHAGDRPRRSAPGKDAIPELPADLFDWPEPRREPSSRRRDRPEPADDPAEDPPENQNGPPRL